jgi:hypothetical protein
MSELRSGLARQLPMLIVLAIAAAGMARVLTQHWREGAVLLGGSLLAAAALRMILSTERSGLLAIRSRAIDVLCYVGFGLAMVILAVTITRGSLTAG